MPQFDLAIVGYGLRALGLLTANPDLREYRLLVMNEAEATIGGGAFTRIHCQSNSLGTDFFNWVDPSGPYASILSLPAVYRLRLQSGCFDLQLLAEALRAAADFVRKTAPPTWRFGVSRVTMIDADPVTGTTLSLADERRGTSRVTVLASGVTERVDPELAALSREIMTSSQLLAERDDSPRAQDLQQFGSVVIIGLAHSAFSSLAKLLDFGVPPERITMVGRSGVRLHYEDGRAHEAASHPPTEIVPMAEDVCPVTQEVFRYRGLRNRSRELFLQVASGRLPVTFRADAGQDKIAEYVRRSQLTIQATGFLSNVPVISMQGQEMPTPGVVNCRADGRLLAPAGAGVPGVFVMGCDPYPYKAGTDPTTQYAERGRSLLSTLEQPEGAWHG
jgi:hypothetical protein